MIAFIVKKLYVSVLTLLGVSIIAFFLMRVIPGDVITAQLGQHYTEGQAERLREQYGLDDPVLVQYLNWLGGAVRGDFGHSFHAHRPVTEAIGQHLPVTLQLAGMSLVFALLVGLPLGIVAAVRRGRWLDYLCGSFGVLGVSIPNFWLATMLILLFSSTLQWLPSAGGQLPSLFADPAGNLEMMIMPTIALGTAVAAVVMRMARSSMLEVLSQDYVRTAKAKGLGPGRVIVGHALKNAMIPILTIIGIQTGYMLGGSVVIEMVFSLPGIGWLAYQSATGRDYLLLQGVILLIATGFIVINLIVDIGYGLLDPRVRSQ